MSGIKPLTPIKIGLLGASFDTGNYGVSALAESSIKCLLERWPDADFIMLASGRSSKSVTLNIGQRALIVPNFPVRFCKNCFMKNHFLVLFLLGILNLFCGKRLRQYLSKKNNWIRQIYDIDIVADITGGDSFSDIYGLRRFVQGVMTKYLWMLYRKPFYFLPQTYGPFQRKWVFRIAKFLLRRAEVVYTRDRKGLVFLKQMFAKESKIAEKIRVVPDVAFILDSHPVSDSLVEAIRQYRQEGGVVVGINISGLLFHGGYTRNNMFNLRADYPQVVHHLTSLFTRELNCLLILIPHVFPPLKVYQVENDLNACLKVAECVRREYPDAKLQVAGECYSHNQMKFLIGQCDFFVGSRMHTCIAGMSQGVPTVGIAYSGKFAGVFESAGQADYVLDARHLRDEDIVCRVKKFFYQRGPIKENMQQQILAVQQEILHEFRIMPYKYCEQDC